ncbi:43kDa postsynaptic protein [Parasponia andersonii]|uniref:43kDa postsynaptic protein n=1 Tax=Parasponia andersonii TaxID=3476 RepID=A0A2P5A4L8_PARAD|nr:43kDa postsynaptic protein [Parasponia andersonii]
MEYYITAVKADVVDHDHHDEDVEFSFSVMPLWSLMEDIPYTLVKVQIHFYYDQLHHRLISEQKQEVQRKHRRSSCRLYLTMLKLVDLSFPLLSRELSKLGVEQERHNEIVKGIVKWAQSAEGQIKETDEPHKVQLLHVQVNLAKQVNVREYCLQCRNQMARKAVLKRFLVQTAKAEARVPTDNGRNATREGSESTTSCPVCFEEFGASTSHPVLTPCSHIFHEKCILKWMLKNPSCPLCRFQMRI